MYVSSTAMDATTDIFQNTTMSRTHFGRCRMRDPERRRPPRPAPAPIDALDRPHPAWQVTTEYFLLVSPAAGLCPDSQ